MISSPTTGNWLEVRNFVRGGWSKARPERRDWEGQQHQLDLQVKIYHVFPFGERVTGEKFYRTVWGEQLVQCPHTLYLEQKRRIVISRNMSGRINKVTCSIVFLPSDNNMNLSDPIFNSNRHKKQNTDLNQEKLK